MYPDRPHRRRLRVGLTYNLRHGDAEAEAEHLDQDYVEDVAAAISSLGHKVMHLEVSETPENVLRMLDEKHPDIVFNLAEGTSGEFREARIPMMLDYLAIPYTGSSPGVLAMALDKRLTEEALSLRGVRVPGGAVVDKKEPKVPKGLDFPLLVKPNHGGSSMGIHQDSIVHNEEDALDRIQRIVKEFDDDVIVEEYIDGRELTIGFLAGARDPFTEVVEYVFPEGRERILDYETKEDEGKELKTVCPAELSEDERKKVRQTAARVVSALGTPDFARIDLRMDDKGDVYVIEINPLPGLRHVSPLVVGARAQGLSYRAIIDAVLTSAAVRYGLVEDEPQWERIQATRVDRPRPRKSQVWPERVNPDETTADQQERSNEESYAGDPTSVEATGGSGAKA